MLIPVISLKLKQNYKVYKERDVICQELCTTYNLLLFIMYGGGYSHTWIGNSNFFLSSAYINHIMFHLEHQHLYFIILIGVILFQMMTSLSTPCCLKQPKHTTIQSLESPVHSCQSGTINTILVLATSPFSLTVDMSSRIFVTVLITSGGKAYQTVSMKYG